MFHLFVCFNFFLSLTPFARKFWNSQSPRFVNIDAFTVIENDPQKFGERNWHDEWNLIWFIFTDLSSKDDWSFVLGTLNYILISRSGKVCASPTRQPEGRFFADSSVKYAPRLSISWLFHGKLHSRRLFSNCFHIQLDLFPPVMIKSNYCFFCHEKIFGMCILLSLW